MAEGGGAPIPLAPQTPTAVFGGGMAATTSTQPPVFRNTGGCAYVFRNTGTWGLETSKCSSPSSMSGYLPRVGLKRGERDLRQSERASCRARGILIVAWGRQGGMLTSMRENRGRSSRDPTFGSHPPCDLVGSESPNDTCGQNRTPTAIPKTWSSLGQACRSGESYLLQGKLGGSIYYAHLTDSPARRSPEQKN